MKSLCLAILLSTAVSAQTKLFLIEEHDKYGFIDAHGTVKIQPTLETWDNFSEGYIKQVKKNWFDNDISFLNSDGVPVIRTTYEEAGRFSEGMARVQKFGFMIQGKWGFIDTMGTVMIQPQFTYVEPFHNGLAIAETNHERGYINHKGEFVWRRTVEEDRANRKTRH